MHPSPSSPDAMDYSSATAELTLAGGTSAPRACVNITIQDDQVLEPQEEEFLVTLTESDPRVMVGRNRATVQIADNDSKDTIV